MRKTKQFVPWKVLVLLEIVLGLLITIVSFMLAANADMNKAEQKLLTTVEYMKKQCNDSEIRDMASEAKSLLRVTESVEQIRWRLEYGMETARAGEISSNVLETYTKDSYLDGLILLDAEGRVEAEYDASGVGSESVLNMVEQDTLMDIVSFPEKSYAVRTVLEDESHFDIAAVSRMDDTGVLVGYYYTSAEYASIINNSIRAIVSGFQPETSGIIAISRGNEIVVCNDPAMEGTRVDDTLILRKIMERGTGKELTHTKDESKLWGNHFGLMEKSRNYYIYAYMDEREVFPSTFPNVLSVLLLYLLIIAIADMLFWRTEKVYERDRLRVQQKYMKTLELKNSQLEAALDRAEKANAAQGSFLARMSHDIRTPLNGIIGLLKIDEDHFEDQELVKENHKKMQVSADHLLSLINDVLQMSRIEAGNVVLTHEVINLAELTRDIVTIIRGRAVEAGVDWDYEKGKELIPYPYIYGSPVHLRQIFLNIYGNCIKYNRYGGKITTIVDTFGEQDNIATYRWTITDTGIGMSQEFLKRIFEPFEQEKNDARSVYQGTGLGMAIVKGLIDQMGGTISVTSKEGIGSKFVIVIPFEIASEPATKAEIQEDSKASIAGLHLMLVEDNELNAEIAEMLLTDQGAKVTLATNGKEAVDLFAEKPQATFDAILMDIMMPVMDGLAATAAIRALDRPDAGQIPIIAMTANAFKEDEEKSIAVGMSAYLAKPIDIEKVKQTIREQVK